MRLFAHHFRDHVMPRLRNLAKAEAVCVTRNVETFSGACDAVMNYARKRGALYLPDDVLDDLEDWIATEVLTQIDAAEAIGAR